MIEIEEVLYQWQQGVSLKKISRSLAISRNTVKKLTSQAQALGLRQDDEAHRAETLHRVIAQMGHKVSEITGPSQQYLSSQHEQIQQWLSTQDMTVVQMVRLFKARLQPVSETSLRRYIAKNFTSPPTSTVHLVTKAGRQGQVDFAYVGLMVDPATMKLRKAYAFIMSLSHSRYRFVRFVFHQDVETWIDCHIRAFHFFGGVPATIMLDNLKAGVIRADVYDPTLNRTYGEFARHYGFVCDPNKVRTPQHKGKVERSVSIVRQQLLAGHHYRDIEHANEQALNWCRFDIAMTVVRTTGRTPWDIFHYEERACLKALPTQEYECATWHELKVHQDHHVVFAGCYYSVPTQYIGKKIWLRAGPKMIEIYLDHHKIKTHVRAHTRGQWITDDQDYPEFKRNFLRKDHQACLEQAAKVGPCTTEFLKKVLQDTTMLSQRKAQAILALADQYSQPRLEAACQHSARFDNYTYRALKKIIAHNYQQLEQSLEPAHLSSNTCYVRDYREFIPLSLGVRS